MKFIVIISLLWCLIAIIFAKSKHSKKSSKKNLKSAVIPKSKETKINLFNKFFKQGLPHKLLREIKSSFSSDLEMLALQLTTPTDEPINKKIFDEFLLLIKEDYTSVETMVSLFLKLSRKLNEPNVFTKMKVLASIHQLYHSFSFPTKDSSKSKVTIDSSEKIGARHSINQCLLILRNKVDDKYGNECYSIDTINSLLIQPSNDLEFQLQKLLEIYSQYFHIFIDYQITSATPVKKESTKQSNKIDNLMKLLDYSYEIEIISNEFETQSNVNDMIWNLVEIDRVWIIEKLKSYLQVSFIHYYSFIKINEFFLF